jgi:hypothetical protein
MGISEETKLYNFIISTLLQHNLAKKALIDYKIIIPNQIRPPKPDLFMYLSDEKQVD